MIPLPITFIFSKYLVLRLIQYFYMKIRNPTLDYRESAQQFKDFSCGSSAPKSPTIIGLNSTKLDKNIPNLLHILDQNRQKMFKNLIKGARGRNNAINYEESFDFLERWETLNKESDFQSVNYEFPQNIFGIIFNVFQLVQKIIVIWFVSVYRIYGLTEYTWPFVLGIVFLSINLTWKGIITAKHYIAIKKQNNPNFNSSQHFKSIIQIFVCEVYTLIYYTILLLSGQLHKSFLGFIAFDFIAGALQYLKGQHLYKKLKLYGIRSAYRNYMNLFDLISNLFIIFHFCAILLFSLTLYSENNWIETVKAEHQDWYSRYLYSIYFTSTTMLTVGYGDILPTNKFEVIAIIMIQVLGTATNGYIFSEVGHTLAKIRQKKENQEKDISDTEKLAKVYRLDSELAGKIRQFMVQNQMENQQLNIEQENNLLHKLSDELRTEVNTYNHMQIIKENIFFIFYFSKKAQIQFAKRLQRKLFSPNQSIYQLVGKQKLWIVTKGKLEIFTDRRQGMRIYCKKKLKEISKIDRKQISDNIFGYSSIISDRPSNLRAITKDFTVIYNLEKSQLLEVVNDDSNDYEAFSELKERILLQKFPERWEVPRITSIRQHYAPCIFFLIRKTKSQMSKMNTKERKYSEPRSDRRCRLVRPFGTERNLNSDETDEQSQNSEQNFMTINETSSKVIDYDARKLKYSKIKELQSKEGSIKNIIPRSYKRKYLSHKRSEEKLKDSAPQKWKLSQAQQNLSFEIGKNFNAFFKRKNLKEILKKLKNAHLIETQLTMVEETIGQFNTGRVQRIRLSCDI